MSSDSFGGRPLAKKAFSHGSASLEKGSWRDVGGWVDLRGMDTVISSGEVSGVIWRELMLVLSWVSLGCRGLHQAIRLVTSSHSSKLTTSW